MNKPKLIDPSATSTTAAPDPFDLASLRLNPNFLETAGVKKLLTTVPARRPSPQDFVRVHPAPEYRMDVAMIDLVCLYERTLIEQGVLPSDFVYLVARSRAR